MTTLDDLKFALAPFLLRRGLRPAERRELVGLLREMATAQEELAAAEERATPVPAPRRQRSSATKTGRPRGSGARFVRVETPDGRSPVLHIGRRLWQDLDEFPYANVQRIGSTVTISPTNQGAGYRVSRPVNGMPRITMGRENVEALGLDVGRYPAEIVAGTIQFTP